MMMKAPIAVFAVLALCGVAVSNAQPVCRVFKTFNAVANTGLVQDTIIVPDAFVVGTAEVSHLVLGHPAPDTLSYSLLHKTSPDAAPVSSTLKSAGAAGGVFAPATPVSVQASAGQWVLRVQDTQPGADQRLLTLTSWTLRLCPSDKTSVSAASGPAQVADASVSVAASASASVNTTGDKASDRSALPAVDHAKGALSLLFPGLSDKEFAPTGVLGALNLAKQTVRKAGDEQVTDALKLIADGNTLYKNFVNKKIQDAVQGVTTAATAASTLFSGKGGLLKGSSMSLLDHVKNLKAFVAADAAGKAESVANLVQQLGGLGGSVVGDWTQVTGTIKQLVLAKLTGMGNVYTSAESAAKAHLDNHVSASAAVLEGLLDKLITGIKSVKDSQLTGPVADFKLNLEAAKLKALADALDKVDKAINALPTPSQALIGKLNSLDDLVANIPTGPVLGGLIGKMQTAKRLLKDTLNNSKP